MARITVDEVVTTYDMNVRPYLWAVKQIQAANKELSESNQRFKGAVSSIAGMITPVASRVTQLGAVLTGALGLAGGFALKSALDFDTLSRKLEAVTGSADRAGQIFQFIDKLAIPSVFQSSELARAAVTMEALQLNTERYLPIAEKLATIFGDGEASLMEYVSALGRLKAGQFGEAFESLRRAGISNNDLRAQGINISKSGEINATPEQALRAVENIVNARLGRVAQAMQSGPAAKMASVFDGLERAGRQAGMSIMKFLMPSVERVGNFISYLVQSRTIEKATQGMLSFFGAGNTSDGIVKALIFVVATIKNIPGFMKSVISAFNEFQNKLAITAGILTAIFMTGRIVAAINMITQAYVALATAIRTVGIAQVITDALITRGGSLAMLKGLALKIGTGVAIAAGTYAMVDAALGGLGNLPGATDFTKQIQGDAKSMYDAFRGSEGKSANPIEGMINAAIAAIEGDQNNPGLGGAPQANYLRQIAENTDPLKSIATQILGGGSLAKSAINRQDISDLRGRTGDWRQDILRALDDGIARAIAERGMSRREV